MTLRQVVRRIVREAKGDRARAFELGAYWIDAALSGREDDLQLLVAEAVKYAGAASREVAIEVEAVVPPDEPQRRMQRLEVAFKERLDARENPAIRERVTRDVAQAMERLGERLGSMLNRELDRYRKAR